MLWFTCNTDCGETFPPKVLYNWDEFGDQTLIGRYSDVKMWSDKEDWFCWDSKLTEKIISGYYNHDDPSGEFNCSSAGIWGASYCQKVPNTYF